MNTQTRNWETLCFCQYLFV